ncbi:MAG: TlpA family protein disulfide reductase [Candidatus Thorarchaeota archaeon]
MEPEKMAIVGVTLVVVVLGTVIGASFLTFPTGNGDNDTQLTRTTQDTDLLELGLEVPTNWEFDMSDGSTLTLSDLEGQVVLVDLMATWCSSCATQNGYLETISEDLAGTVVVVSLTVDTSETTSMMADYKSSKGLSWAHGVDDRHFLDYFSISSVPSMVLIDADGFFRYFHVGLWTDASISSKIGLIM